MNTVRIGIVNAGIGHREHGGRAVTPVG